MITGQREIKMQQCSWSSYGFKSMVKSTFIMLIKNFITRPIKGFSLQAEDDKLKCFLLG